MSKDQFPFLLKNLLPESSWPWVTAALRQNSLVWGSLQDPALAEKAIQACGALPKAWSPAAIALTAFHTLSPSEPRLTPSDLCTHPLVGLKAGVRQQVLRFYENSAKGNTLGFRHPNGKGPQPNSFINQLAEAGMLALALRERLRKIGSWVNLPDELRGPKGIPLLEWETPLACLYGMIPQPQDLLQALIDPQDMQAGIVLCVRILLSQPMPLPAAQEALMKFKETLSSSLSKSALAELFLLRALSVHRPDLALALATAASSQEENASTNPASQRDWSTTLESLIQQAIYYHYSSQSQPALAKLGQMREKIQMLQGDIDLFEAFLKSPSGSEKSIPVEAEPTLPSSLANLAFLRQQQYRKELAGSLYEMGLWAESAEATRGALEDTPNDPDLLLKLGKTLLKQGKTDEASETLQSAVLLDTERLDLRRQLAEILEAERAWQEALEERETVIEKSDAVEPGQKLEDYHALANCALNSGQIERAQEASQSALAINPEDGLAYSQLGEALFQAGKVEESMSAFSQAVLLAPHLEYPWLVQARILEKMGQSQQSLETLKAASQALPDSSEIQLALGEKLMEHQSPTQALEAFRKSYESTKSHSPYELQTRAALRLGETLRHLGHLDEAQEVLAQAYHLNPLIRPGISAELAYLYAQILLDHQEVCLALPILADVIKTKPAGSSPYLDYGRALLSTGQSAQEASQVLQQALEKDPCSFEAQALLAEAFAATQDHPMAIKTFRLCLESPLLKEKGWLARLSAGLGRSALALGQSDTAIAALEEAVQAEPDNPVHTRNLADAYWSAGLFSRAVQSARAVMLLDGNDLATMNWFGGLALQLAQQEGGWVITEALDALRKAVHLAPDRSDLVVRLGHLQLLAGDIKEASHTLREIINQGQANATDLEQTGQLFLKMDDFTHAETCLERAMMAQGDVPASTSLVSSLAEACRKAGNPERALNVLQEAIQIRPDQVRLYYDLVDTLLELKQPEQALTVLDNAMGKLIDPGMLVDLQLRAAELNRQTGKLSTALSLAETALASSEALQEPTPTLAHASQVLAASLLIADLQRALLQPEKAYRELEKLMVLPILKHFRGSRQNKEASNDLPATTRRTALPYQTQENVLDVHCLMAELALEAGEEIEAAKLLNQMIEHAAATSFPPQLQQKPRLMALQSRLLLRQNDFALSRQIYEEALQIAESTSTEAYNDTTPAGNLGLAEISIELGEWATAQKLIQKAVQEAPAEPYAMLSLARFIVLKAEAQSLCQALGIVTHTTDPHALDEGLSTLFHKTIQSTLRNLSLGEDSAMPAYLTRWLRRGEAIYGPQARTTSAESTALNIEEWLGYPAAPHPGDYAAYLARLERMASVNKEDNPLQLDQLRRQIADQAALIVSMHPQDTLILMQAARATFYHNPQDAICIAQSAIACNAEKTLTSGSFLTAAAHSLLATLALQAGDYETAGQSIQVALKIWPDEPRWHALAADCLEYRSEITREQLLEALDHRQEALRLEPEHLESYLSLGRSCLIAAHLDEHWLAEAISTLEQACHLQLDNPLPWLWLAEAHLINVIGDEKQRKGSLKEASACAERAIGLADQEANPCGVRARIVRAEAALQLGEAETSYEYAQEAVQLMPGDASAVLMVTNALEALHRPAEALEALEKGLPWMSKQSERAQALKLNLKYAELVRQAQGVDAALRVVNNLMETYPNEPEVLALLARNLNENAHAEAAIQAAQMALQASAAQNNLEPGKNLSSPERAKLHLLAGRLLGQNGQLDQAVHHLDEAITLDSKSVDSYLELGMVYQKQRQYLKAQKTFERATEMAPHDPRPFIQAGVAFKEGKDYIRAEAMLRRAAELSPEDVDVKKMLAGVAAHNLLRGGVDRTARTHSLAGR